MEKSCKFCKLPFQANKKSRQFCSKSCKGRLFKPRLGHHNTKNQNDKISLATKKQWKEGRLDLIKGQSAPWWKGDKASYVAIHRHAAKLYRKKFCEQCKKTGLLHLANKTGKYLRENSDDWITLCPLCHKRYDMAEPKNSRFFPK